MPGSGPWRDCLFGPIWLRWLGSNQRMRESKSRAFDLLATPQEKMVVSARVELATHALGGHRSIHLSYETRMERAAGIEPVSAAWEADILPMNYVRKKWSRRRGSNLRPADYKAAALPAELRRHMERATRFELATFCLEGRRSTTELYPQMAERVGFEPTVRRRITCFQDRLLKPLGHLSMKMRRLPKNSASAPHSRGEVPAPQKQAEA